MNRYKTATVTGLRFDAESAVPNVYTVLLTTEEDDIEALFVDRQLVFVLREVDVHLALSLAGLPVGAVDEIVVEPLLMDFARAFHLVQDEFVDTESTILNLLNCVEDLLPAAGIPIPEAYRAGFRALADRTTWHEEFGSVFDETLTRQLMIDFLRWALGTIFSAMRLLGEPSDRSGSTPDDSRV